MFRFDEHLFGRLAVLNGYLTQEDLQEALTIQRSLGSDERRPIGEILLEQGRITQDQLAEILEIRRKKLRKMLLDSKDLVRTERAFGRQAMKAGLIDADQLERALLEQQRLRRLNLQLCLGDIMVSLGYMTVDDVLDVLARQEARILVCPSCDSHFTVHAFSPSAKYRCKHCESVLEIPKYLDTVATDGSLGADDAIEGDEDEEQEPECSHAHAP